MVGSALSHDAETSRQHEDQYNDFVTIRIYMRAIDIHRRRRLQLFRACDVFIAGGMTDIGDIANSLTCRVSHARKPNKTNSRQS